MSNNSAKYRAWAVCVVLAAITFAAFEAVLNNKFINYDDDEYITENQHIQKGFTADAVKWAFTTGKCANWHPLTWLSHILDCKLFGLNPWGHHLVSLLLHIANTVLLFMLLRAMTAALWKSAFVAAIFAVHPLHVESVAWASERKDVLSGLFWILTMGAYLRYVRRPTAARYLLTLLLFALGLMTKPMLVTLPFVLLLLDYWPLDRLNSRTAVLEKVPFFVLSAVSSIVTFLVQRSAGAVPGVERLGLRWRIADAVISYAKYIREIFWPSGLSVHYPYDFASLGTWKVVAAGLFLLAVTILIIRQAGKRRYLPVGWLWYLGTLVPVIGLVQAGGQAMADRYTYIPLTGLFIIAAWGIEELSYSLPGRKAVMGILAAGIISALIIYTSSQVHYWHDSIAVFEHAVKVTKNNSKGYYKLGVAYGQAGRYNEAIDAYKKAAQIQPDYADAHYNLGVAYGKLGRDAEATEAYKETVKIKPDYAEAYNNLGVTYSKNSRFAEAIDAYKKAVQIKPDYAEAHDNLGAVYSKIGHFAEAIEEFKEAVKIRPDYAKAYDNLGVAYGRLGRNAEAIESLKEAVKIRPDYDKAQFNLGVAYSKTGRLSEAIEAYKRAVKIKPDYIEAHLNLGVTYIEAGETALALEEYKIIKRLDAKKAEILFTLIHKGRQKPATGG